MPIISVIVAIYNSKKFLSRCIDSILAQSFQKFELILVDDGSTDGCAELCDSYSKIDGRIRVIHQRNAGQAAARNVGVSVSKGEWIYFCDSDDMIHFQLLEILYNGAISNQVKLSMCGAYESEAIPQSFYEEKKPQWENNNVTEDFLVRLLLSGNHNYWVLWDKLISKNIIERYPIPEGRIFEDNAVVFQWIIEAKKITVTECKLYFYYINPNGTTKSGFSKKKLDELWANEQRIIKYCQLNFRKILYLEVESYLKHVYRLQSEIKKDRNEKELSLYVKKKGLKTIIKYSYVFSSKLLFIGRIIEVLMPRKSKFYWVFYNLIVQ